MIQLYRTNSVWIFNYSLYGERHSGTNFLEQSINGMFGLPRTQFFGTKHFFGFATPERIWYERHTLFLGIIRDPYDWILAMYDLPHHVPLENRLTLKGLMFNEWYSITGQDNKENLSDRNYTTRPNLQRYKNIFELRKTKLKFLYEEMPLLAQNYILVSYEEFVNSHKYIMTLIKNRFNLKQVGDPPTPYKKNKKEIEPDIKKYIDDNIDWEIEASVGYYPR
jgi:hypothetical protein